MLPLLRSLRPRPALLFGSALVALVLGAGHFFDQVAQARSPAVGAGVLQLRGDLGRDDASGEVRQLAQWVLEARDHAGLPFVILDKARARLFTFDAAGRLAASTPVLLGAARDDDAQSAATPAGRFTGDPRLAQRPEAGLLWVGSRGELVLHGAWGAQTPGRAQQRLASTGVDDKRISDGTVHVPPEFFERHLRPLNAQRSVAYVLPERLGLKQLFGAYDVEPAAQPS